MKKIILLVVLLVLSIVFVGCNVAFDIQKDDSIIITIECDDDDVDEYGEDFDFDEGDLDDDDDLEDLLDDVIDEIDLEGDIYVKSFKRKKNDFILKFVFIPNDDIDDALLDGIAVGSASDVLDEFADMEYDDDFEDIYDDEFADDVDDEIYYAFDREGDELTDKEMEKYFDKAKLTKLKAAVIEGEDIDITVPGRIEMIISPDDSVDVDDDVITAENYVIVIYKTRGNALLTLLIIALIAGLGAGGYFAYNKFFSKKEDDVEVDMNIE